MKRATKALLTLGLGAALFAGAGLAYAQAGDSALADAVASGVVGEKVDGYLGIAKSASPDIRVQVDAINIKRRAAYTPEAAKRGVTLEEWAASIGCQTLRNRVKPGQAYQLADGVWRTKGAEPIALPGACG